MNKKSELFHGKLLLFGEYSVLLGSMALSIPFKMFKANFDFMSSNKSDKEKKSNSELKKYFKYLLSNSNVFDSILNLTDLEKDINSGLFFDSSIPVSYGVGSSGALCAAIYKHYGKISEHNEINLRDLKQRLSLLESGFHGKSSGLDPLISYVNKPVLVSGNDQLELVNLKFDKFLENAAVFLIDTQQKGDTAPLVNDFLLQCESVDFRNKIVEKLIPVTQQCINSLCNNDIDNFFESIQSVSSFQYQNFTNKIPSGYRTLWKTGLDSNKFWLKLCGSGGGGYLLGFTRNMNETEKFLSKMEFSYLQITSTSMK
ncbi:mevalonate kinase [Marinifilum sp. D714]|uniref:mevalonate kinase family protein n=1 Tax=Marinifilum sp. D714 TaxID=2937523 RepID=UPI0027D087E3|nr:mevalonate kinase [Marinifilum sp. D714]MDQ2179942.1 mevalonate kinase [Marinifilum sp. D714]